MSIGVFHRHDIEHTLVAADEVRRLLEARRPVAAVVHGGLMAPLLIDVQRWLNEFRVPTMILVQHLSDHHEAALLNRGARDVVALPASPRKLGSRLEVFARSQAVLVPRRSLPVALRLGGAIEIFPTRRMVAVHGEPVVLTKSEFDLLLALALRPQDVLTREELTKALGRRHLSSRALESHVSRLRVKLTRAGASGYLENVRGIGYRAQAIDR